MQKNKEPMNASLQFCPNETCCARGQIGVGNISIHGRKRPRYKCHTCGKTFGERKGTMLEGLRTDRERLASLTRKCRHAAARVATLEEGMYLIGCTYNFCFPHQELSKNAHFGWPTIPAMAAALTDHMRECSGGIVV